MSNDTEAELKKIISAQALIDEDQITLKSKFTNDLGVDSLDMVEIIMAIEDKFKIIIDETAVDKVETVQDAVNIINNKKQ